MAIDLRKVLRLNLPQWQGGDRLNYRIGGRGLAAIAPEAQGPEETVLVPIAGRGERPVEGGIVSRGALLEQLAARSAITRHEPEAIVTLGGDCHVDLPPIAASHSSASLAFQLKNSKPDSGFYNGEIKVLGRGMVL